MTRCFTQVRWATRCVNVKMWFEPNEIPTVDTSLTYAQLDAALAGATLSVDASELDGLLVGYVCGGGKTHGQSILAALQLDNDDAELDALAAEMHDACIKRLGQLEMGLTPLLPPDAEPMRVRVDALVDWTRGFLGGFGLTGAASDNLTDAGREVLRDMGAIAGSRPTLDSDDDQGSDEDESALMELLEFVRVGAMLLQTETAMADSTPADGRLH